VAGSRRLLLWRQVDVVDLDSSPAWASAALRVLNQMLKVSGPAPFGVRPDGLAALHAPKASVTLGTSGYQMPDRQSDIDANYALLSFSHRRILPVGARVRTSDACPNRPDDWWNPPLCRPESCVTLLAAGAERSGR
jgi:hypothetical protein